MAKKKSKKYPHKWPDGSYHSIPYTTHRQNVQARGYGIDLDAPLSAPLTNRQAFGMAEAAADKVYGPQIKTQETLNNSIDPWFQGYVAEVGKQREAAKTFAQPYVTNAQTAVTNAGTTAPGLDPNSPQYATERQAAAGRQAIAQSSANTLAAIPILTDNAYGNAIVLANRELPQMRAHGAQQLQGLQGQRGNAVVEGYGGYRSGEQNADIAYQTLGLNKAEAGGYDPFTGEKMPGKPEDVITSGAFAGMTDSEVTALSPRAKQRKIDSYAQSKGTSGDKINKYGIPESQWARWSTSHRQRVIREFGKKPSSGGKSAAEQKRIEGVRKASGDFKARIGDAIGDWDRISREPFPYQEETVKDGKKVKVNKTRKATDSEVRAAMRKAGYTPMEIHIALLRRKNKPLDKTAVDYMKSKGVRIPREWLKGAIIPGGIGDPKPTGGQQNGLGGK